MSEATANDSQQQFRLKVPPEGGKSRSVTFQLITVFKTNKEAVEWGNSFWDTIQTAMNEGHPLVLTYYPTKEGASRT